MERIADEAEETTEVNAIEDNWKIIREAVYSETIVDSPNEYFDARTELAVEYNLTEEQIDTYMVAKDEAKVLMDKARDLAFDAAMSLLEGTLVVSDIAEEFGLVKDPMDALPENLPKELTEILGIVAQTKNPLTRTLVHNLRAVEKMMVSATGYALHMHEGECDDCNNKGCPVMKVLRQPKGTRIPIE